MNKLFLLLAVISLFLSIYYFFISRNLLNGSIAIIMVIVANLLYAMFINSEKKK